MTRTFAVDLLAFGHEVDRRKVGGVFDAILRPLQVFHRFQVQRTEKILAPMS